MILQILNTCFVVAFDSLYCLVYHQAQENRAYHAGFNYAYVYECSL